MQAKNSGNVLIDDFGQQRHITRANNHICGRPRRSSFIAALHGNSLKQNVTPNAASAAGAASVARTSHGRVELRGATLAPWLSSHPFTDVAAPGAGARRAIASSAFRYWPYNGFLGSDTSSALRSANPGSLRRRIKHKSTLCRCSARATVLQRPPPRASTTPHAVTRSNVVTMKDMRAACLGVMRLTTACLRVKHNSRESRGRVCLLSVYLNYQRKGLTTILKAATFDIEETTSASIATTA